jgi:hypothetical protein
MPCTLFEAAWYLRGYDRFLVDLVFNVDFVNELLDIEAIDQVAMRSMLTNAGVLFEAAASLKPARMKGVYNLVRTGRADRELLRFMPADSMIGLTLSLDDAARRYDRILEWLMKVHQIEKEAGKNSDEKTPAEDIAELEAALNLSLRNDIAAHIRSMAIGVLEIDPAAIVTVADPGQEVIVYGAYVILRVEDPEAFDAALRGIVDGIAAAASEGTETTVTIDTEKVAGGEMRAYPLPESPLPVIVYKSGDVYAFTLSEEVARTIHAAHSGAEPSLQTDPDSRDLLLNMSAAASKILAVRPDLIANFVLGLHERKKETTSPWPPGEDRFPPMKPVLFYTLEEETSLVVRCEVSDVPSLISSSVRLFGPAPTQPAASLPEEEATLP